VVLATDNRLEPLTIGETHMLDIPEDDEDFEFPELETKSVGSIVPKPKQDTYNRVMNSLRNLYSKYHNTPTVNLSILLNDIKDVMEKEDLSNFKIELVPIRDPRQKGKDRPHGPSCNFGTLTLVMSVETKDNTKYTNSVTFCEHIEEGKEIDSFFYTEILRIASYLTQKALKLM
jgi:hypothetical protein